MKIVEINTVCDTGSTGRIAAGIARLATTRGHDVYFAYGRGTHPDDIKGYKIGNPVDFVVHVLINFFKGQSGFGSKAVTKRFLRWLDFVQPDVLHLHNLHGFYIHVGLLFEYIKEHNIPVIWTFHDCWPFTGQCAYFDYIDCNKWKSECYDCPIYRSNYPYSLFCDNSKDNYKKKKQTFAGLNGLTIITPSIWLESLVKQSFLKDYPVKVINNGIDTEVFRPIDIEKPDKKIILGVANVWTKSKGIEDFFTLAGRLTDEYYIVLVGVSGRIQRKIRKQYPNRMRGIRHTDSVNELVLWYNRASVFVNPTKEDNYPTTNLEALACGTPVVTYATGGSPEMITEKCGIVVEKNNVDMLLEAIYSVTSSFEYTRDNCRNVGDRYGASGRLMEYISEMENIDS